MFNDIKNLLQTEAIENVPDKLFKLINEKTSSSVLMLDDTMKIVMKIPQSASEQLNKNIYNHDLRREYVGEGIVILPIKSHEEYIASLVLFKEGAFTKEDMNFIEMSALVLAVSMMFIRHSGKKSNMIVKSAINTLSYSELEAILVVFQEIDGCEALIVASSIAKKANITRSVIVNAFKKLESAGVLETRSLGVKGTHIKVLNETLFNELKKYRK